MYIRDKKRIDNVINFLYMESSSNISDYTIEVLQDVCHCIDKESMSIKDINKYSCYDKNGDLLTQFTVDNFNINVDLSFISYSVLNS